jgi:hypothetical protein
MITQTPWSFQQDSITERDGCGYISDADGNHISHHGNINRSRAENLANAAFIVRAVNSHEALVKALEAVDRLWSRDALNFEFEMGFDSPVGKVWAELRAALAAAREAGR